MRSTTKPKTGKRFLKLKEYGIRQYHKHLLIQILYNYFIIYVTIIIKVGRFLKAYTVATHRLPQLELPKNEHAVKGLVVW